MPITYTTGAGNTVTIPSDASDLERSEAEKRAKRNQLLAKSDWTQITDNGMSSAKKDEWITYRQELRDVDFSENLKVDGVSTPKNFPWPTEPE